MSTPPPGKRPLDASEIDDHDSTISTSRSSKRVSLSPSNASVQPAIKPSFRQEPRSVDSLSIASCDFDTTDDEVEFLYTNPAPSFPLPEATPARDETCHSTAVDRTIDRTQRSQESGCWISPELAATLPETTTSAKVTSTTNTSTSAPNAIWKRQFSHRSSAYLQSLAEICHAVLSDARWRVATPRDQSPKRLFAWERGDEMSAVHTLARRYLPLTQLLRGNDQVEVEETVQDKRSSESSISKDNHDGQHRDFIANGNSDRHEVTPESESDLDRCLETYSRLYFRKGPWFRLDNVFTSYYLPKHMQSTNRSTSPDLDGQSPSSTTPAPHREATVPAPVKNPTIRTAFFVPMSQRREGRDSNKSGNKRIDDDYIDQGVIGRQIAAAEVLLVDVGRLHRMGLVRSFHSEEECGKQVGKSEPYASGILRQDEQRLLLSKLGGRHQARKYPPHPSNKAAASSASSAYTTSSSATKGISDNLIWKQMCQQKAIFNGFCNVTSDEDKHSSRPYLLPVVKHVNRILIEKWATGIVLKARKVEYIPSSILRSATRSVLESLEKLTATYHLDDALCVRLREAPLQTLRRACRLYLCATSGPGDMRGDGINAWRSLPESHTKDLFLAPLRTAVIPQPGSHSWNSTAYPGRDWRLRLQSYNFINAHIPVPATEGGESKKTKNVDVDVLAKIGDIRVFSSVRSFESWEQGVELRATVDYLLELNELLLYNERKQARQREAGSDEGGNNIYVGAEISHTHDSTGTADTKVDYLDLLTIAGRTKVVSDFLSSRKRDCMQISDEIEREVSALLGTPIDDIPLSAWVGMKSVDASMSPTQPMEKTRLQNECERILGVVAVVLLHVLENRNATASSSDVSPISSRPWLRHMCWEGCMAYVLWDVIPILERRGYYEFSVKALEVLLFGKRLPRASNGSIPDNLVEGTQNSRSIATLAQSFLSRRARGKAYERLLIDYTHVQRKNAVKVETSTDRQGTTKGRRGKTKLKSPPMPNPPTTNELVAHLTKPLLRAHTPTGQITFSATRTLARRLKCPLASSLKDLNVYETQELGHRFSNDDVGQLQQEGAKYSDWTPVTDTAVANAMISNGDPVGGGRCAYIGFEDDEVKNFYSGSLNVEELAMEYYNKGVLPVTDDQSTTKGGWVGWHDEGGKIRALFRILSSATLGMDWGDVGRDCDDYTLFLTPYQGAPFDLHVGAELVGSASCRPPVPQRGIYNRKRTDIDEFLESLSHLQGEELANLVYDCINKRLMHSTSFHRIDPTLERDVSQVRTLSMLAAGLGGNMLAAAFRCLFFDYRHYCGGLPDLLLVRAICAPSDDHHQSSGELVDLGDWIGESFGMEYQDAMKAKKIAQVFADKDEEFLGCSKVGDSGGRGPAGRGTPGPKRNGDDPSVGRGLTVMPDRLRLCHNDRKVRVECMCVEVKSQNDRLDPRQEDWLNILDRFGNARVCKFERPKKLPKAIISNRKENGSSPVNSSDRLSKASSS